MVIQINEIEHFSKMMNFLGSDILSGYTKVSQDTFNEFMEKPNYFRDWWWDCVLYKTRHNSKIIGIIKKGPKTFYLKNKRV